MAWRSGDPAGHRPRGVTTGYLQVVKDIEWLVPDASMIGLAIHLLPHKYDGTRPDQ